METDTTRKVKHVFEVVFLAIFIYQMYKGTEKYIQGPVFNEELNVNLEDFSKPVIYICSKASFNYTAARKNGYKSQLSFMLGDLDDTNLTSWKELSSDMIYDILGDNLDGINITLKMKKVFRIPEGICYKSEEFKFEEIIGLSASEFGYKLYIIDPYKDTPFHLGMPDVRGPQIEIEHFEKGFAVSQWFDVRFSLHDQIIKDGTDCMDYEKEDSSYGQCVFDATKDQLINLLGCLPPWFMPEVENCTTMKRITGQRRKQLSSLAHTLLFKRPLDSLTGCKPPCLKMTYRVTKLNDRKLYSDYDTNFLFVFPNSDAILSKETYSYDIFALIVEIGSALGLWIGFSALGIIDLGLVKILDSINYLKKRLIIK